MPNAFTNAINSITGEEAPRQNMMTRALNNVRDSNATAAMQNTLGVPAADSLCPSLSFKQRLYGCIGCFCVGIFLSIIGWFAWIGARARATPDHSIAHQHEHHAPAWCRGGGVSIGFF